jgi:type IV pilus assembly protein PilM
MKLLNQFLAPKRSHIGIDVGSHAVKLVELSAAEKGAFKIKNVGYARIENPASREGQVQAIKECAAKTNFHNKEASVAVSGPSVIVRFIELPRMTPDELRNAIPFEAEKYIPFSRSEVTIDHQLLIPRLGNNLMLVLLVAVKKEVISERLGLMSGAGLPTGILDVSSFANVNAFLANTAGRNDEIRALIDIGAKGMDINIVDGDVLYFTRSIQIGGDDITKSLSEVMSIDLKSAEEMKVKPGDKAAEVSEKIEPVLRNMIDETRLSFSYYENQSGKNIGKVYLTGGSARIANFCTMYKDNLGIDTELWDPTARMEVDQAISSQVAGMKDQLGVAIGLALR